MTVPPPATVFRFLFKLLFTLFFGLFYGLVLVPLRLLLSLAGGCYAFTRYHFRRGARHYDELRVAQGVAKAISELDKRMRKQEAAKPPRQPDRSEIP